MCDIESRISYGKGTPNSASTTFGRSDRPGRRPPLVALRLAYSLAPQLLQLLPQLLQLLTQLVTLGLHSRHLHFDFCPCAQRWTPPPPCWMQ